MKAGVIRVLCVDDNAQVVHALKTALTSSGYAVDTATSGWEGLRQLRQGPASFRVVVTDMRMPGMSGVQMIKQGRALGYRGPFVVCAAGLADADRVSLSELGVQQIIDKTSRIADLIEAVEHAAASYTPVAAEPVTPPVASAVPLDDELTDPEPSDDDESPDFIPRRRR